MTIKKEMLDLLEATLKLEEAFESKIEESWNLETMIEALNQLADEYKRQIEEHRKPGSDVVDEDTVAMLSNDFFEILRLKSILGHSKHTWIRPLAKKAITEAILDYYSGIKGFIEDEWEVEI